MDPFSLTMIAMGAISAGSKIYSGWKQKEAAEENAELLRKQAEFQKQQAYEQAIMMREQGEAYKGSQKASIASSGIKATEGSPLMALRESERNIRQDVRRTREAGDRALELGINQADVLEQQGQDAFTSSVIGGATSFAGTLASNINIPKSTPTGGGYLNEFTTGAGPNLTSWQSQQLGTYQSGFETQPPKLLPPSIFNPWKYEGEQYGFS